MIKLVFVLLCMSVIPVNATEGLTAEELEQWFNDDSSNDEERALAVNEGELEFLLKQPEKAVHHSQNVLTITRDSLSTGWISLKQCHVNLDAVAASQIVYRYKRMRNLMVDSFERIQRVWVEGSSVQVEDIQRGAKLCIRADVGILYSGPKGSAILKNGPFHRKFLDGYYPMHVTLEIHYPGDLISYKGIVPKQQPGFSVTQRNNALYVDAWFEGELRTEVRFSRISQN